MPSSADLFFRPPRDADDAGNIVAAVCQLLDLRQLVLRPPPPMPTSCCGRGCSGCVWQGYFDALRYWRDDARALLGGFGPREAGSDADQAGYTAAQKITLSD